MQDALIVLLLTIGATASSVILPFSPPLPQDEFSLYNSTVVHHELLKRAFTCPNGWKSCNYLSAPQLCCKASALCQADFAGNVACCPQGAVCTGAIGGVAVSGSFSSQTAAFPGITQGSAVTTNGGVVLIGATGDATVTIGGSGGTKSYVQNQYYPFPAIPTTYTNARACSAAWTGCQSDMTSCTNFLGGSFSAQRVTVSAPNGGVTIQTPTATYGMTTAYAICSSLSQQACSGLQVTACAVFGNHAPTKACDLYGVGVGFAVGMAGQMLAMG